MVVVAHSLAVAKYIVRRIRIDADWPVKAVPSIHWPIFPFHFFSLSLFDAFLMDSMLLLHPL